MQDRLEEATHRESEKIEKQMIEFEQKQKEKDKWLESMQIKQAEEIQNI